MQTPTGSWSPSNPLRVGIVGCGRVGIDTHVPQIRLAGGAVTALADVVAGRAARFAAQCDVPLAFDDWRELVAHHQVDIVSICSTPPSHEAIATAALAAGKHVYLEKPPTMSQAEMVRIAQAAQRAGRRVMTGSNSIFHHEIQDLRRRIAAGELGTVYLVECLKRSRRRLPLGWQRQRRLGGGIGMDAIPHRLDQVLFLLGQPRPLSVVARTYRHFGSAASPANKGYLPRDVEEKVPVPAGADDAEDTLVAMIQFDGGATAILRDAYAANLPDQWHASVYGTAAGAVYHHAFALPDQPPLLIYAQDATGRPADAEAKLPPRAAGAHVQAFEHFFNVIRSNSEDDCGLSRSVALMGIIDAIYQSAESGRETRMG